MSPEDEPLRRLDIPRRRQGFISLLLAVVITGALAIAGLSIMRWGFFIFVVALAGYVVYLIETKKRWDSFTLIGGVSRLSEPAPREDAWIRGENVIDLNSAELGIKVRYPPKPHRRPQPVDSEEFWALSSAAAEESYPAS
jgi:hypothetical protein